jgi:hypothetical protein
MGDPLERGVVIQRVFRRQPVDPKRRKGRRMEGMTRTERRRLLRRNVFLVLSYLVLMGLVAGAYA